MVLKETSAEMERFVDVSDVQNPSLWVRARPKDANGDMRYE